MCGICVYVCVCICICVSVCVHVPNGKPRGRFLVFYSITFCTCLPLRQGLSLTLDSSTVTSLTGQQARVTLFFSALYSNGITGSHGNIELCVVTRDPNLGHHTRQQALLANETFPQHRNIFIW